MGDKWGDHLRDKSADSEQKWKDKSISTGQTGGKNQSEYIELECIDQKAWHTHLPSTWTVANQSDAEIYSKSQHDDRQLIDWGSCIIAMLRINKARAFCLSLCKNTRSNWRQWTIIVIDIIVTVFTPQSCFNNLISCHQRFTRDSPVILLSYLSNIKFFFSRII